MADEVQPLTPQAAMTLLEMTEVPETPPSKVFKYVPTPKDGDYRNITVARNGAGEFRFIVRVGKLPSKTYRLTCTLALNTTRLQPPCCARGRLVQPGPGAPPPPPGSLRLRLPAFSALRAVTASAAALAACRHQQAAAGQPLSQ
jgi:hypothetical protein